MTAPTSIVDEIATHVDQTVTDVQGKTVAEISAREATLGFQEVKTKSRSAGLTAAFDIASVFFSSGCNVVVAFDRFASNWSDHSDHVDYAAQVAGFGASMLAYTVRRGQFDTAVRDIRDIKSEVDIPILLHDPIINPHIKATPANWINNNGRFHPFLPSV